MDVYAFSSPKFLTIFSSNFNIKENSWVFRIFHVFAGLTDCRQVVRRTNYSIRFLVNSKPDRLVTRSPQWRNQLENQSLGVRVYFSTIIDENSYPNIFLIKIIIFTDHAVYFPRVVVFILCINNCTTRWSKDIILCFN